MITPVIVIPGVMGSRLKLSSTTIPNIDDSSEIPHLGAGLDWDPDDGLGMLKWYLFTSLQSRLMVLSVDNHPYVSPFEDFAPSALAALYAYPFIIEVESKLSKWYIERGWHTIAWTFYGKLLLELEITLNRFNFLVDQTLPFPVYAFGYDWRQSNQHSGDKLAKLIDIVLADHPGAEQVILVTHSMGGLVARYVCLSQDIVAKIKGVIHIAQPSNGSLTAYRRFFTGFKEPFEVEPSFFGRESFWQRIAFEVLQRILGEDPLSYAMLMSGLPGPMELLPNHSYTVPDAPWLITSPPAELTTIYEVYKAPYQPGIVPDGLSQFVASQGNGLNGDLIIAALQARIENAEQFHQALGDNAHPNTYVLVGTGVTTDERIHFTGTAIEVTHSSNGDGTVYEESARLSAVNQSFIKQVIALPGSEHSAICSDSRAIKIILNYINRIASPANQLSLADVFTQQLGLTKAVLSRQLAPAHSFWTTAVSNVVPQAAQVVAQVTRHFDINFPQPDQGYGSQSDEYHVPSDMAEVINEVNEELHQLELLLNPMGPPLPPIGPPPPPIPDEGGVTLQFLARHGNAVFNSSADIDTFFQKEVGTDFITWFNQHIAHRNHWGAMAIEDTPRSRQRFRDLWDRIPQMFDAHIGLIQFISLMSVIINETGGRIQPISEGVNSPGHPGIAHLFDTFMLRNYPKSSYNRAPNNRTAGSLFRDANFIAAHGRLALGNILANTTDVIWDGEVYPQNFPTSDNPAITGFILQADFYKFRGRGFIQTTWRSNYLHIINYVQNYTGTDPTILGYRTRWLGVAPGLIATQSSNQDWDELFMNTGFDIPCQGVYLHSNASGQYLNTTDTPQGLNTTNRRRRGSIFYMGYRVSGSEAYGRILKDRVVQILNGLGNNNTP